MTRNLESYILLTTQHKLCFSIDSTYQIETFVLMSAKNMTPGDGSPCTVKIFYDDTVGEWENNKQAPHPVPVILISKPFTIILIHS